MVVFLFLCKLHSIPALPPWLPEHWSWYSVPYAVPWSQWTDTHRWADRATFHFVVWQQYVTIWNTADLSHHGYQCWNTPPSTSKCQHLLFGLHRCSASSNACQWVQVFPQRNSVFYFLSTNNTSKVSFFFQKKFIFIAADACNNYGNTQTWTWDYTPLVSCLPVAMILISSRW